jgi:PDZ domain
MVRCIVTLGLLAVIAAPAAAQVDSSGAAGRHRAPIRSAREPGITAREEGWLGMGISCGHCSLTVSPQGGSRRWTFAEPPSVYSVDDSGPADRAGLRIGDVLLAVNGQRLTSDEGGAAFGSVRPGQEVTLTYRRDGHEASARLVAGARPLGDTRALAAAARTLRRAQVEQQRQLAESRDQLERVQEQLERASRALAEQVAQIRREDVDTAALAELGAALASQHSALAAILADRATLEGQAESLAAAVAAVPPVPPVPAMAPALAEPPAPPAYGWSRASGRLRYSGRLGDVTIEARGPGEVTATESDSEVVVSAGDLSVRLALRPRTPPPAPPAPARPPRPARPPKD